jgi:hypothetical protein
VRILIVSAAFDERERIGAVRPRAFAGRLAALGHEVTVATQTVPASTAPPVELPGVTVLRVPRPAAVRGAHRLAVRAHGALRRRTAAAEGPSGGTAGEAPASGGLPSASSLVALAPLAYRAADDGLWALAAARSLRGALDLDPDVILSSYGPFASLWLGWRLARDHPRARWVSDFRDPLADTGRPAPVDRLLRRHERAALARADVVTTVSAGLRDGFAARLADVADPPPIHLLPNGFERGDEEPRRPERRDRVLRVGYTGSLYPGRSDAAPLFAALRQLIAAGDARPDEVEVHYAGRDGALFRRQAEGHGLADRVVDHGLVPKAAAVALQRDCDLLLVLSWNTPGRTGVLTGKIYEYMRSGQPVLALTSGDLPGAELSGLVDDLRLGLAYEEARSAQDRPRLVDFLRAAFAARRSGHGVPVTPSDRVGDYDYDRIAERLEALCRDAVTSPEIGAPAGQTNY